MKREPKCQDFHYGCKKCVNWELMANSYLMRFNPPKDYPLDNGKSEQYLTPTEITFESLTKCIEISTKKFRDGIWNSNNVTAY